MQKPSRIIHDPAMQALGAYDGGRMLLLGLGTGIFNKGSVMALPSGVNKASGLTNVLKDLGTSANQVSAVGNAENDLAFLQASGFPVAVANALPSVKAAAHWVTPRARVAGVAEFIVKLIGA